jgi:hypothetical protein
MQVLLIRYYGRFLKNKSSKKINANANSERADQVPKKQPGFADLMILNPD